MGEEGVSGKGGKGERGKGGKGERGKRGKGEKGERGKRGKGEKERGKGWGKRGRKGWWEIENEEKYKPILEYPEERLFLLLIRIYIHYQGYMDNLYKILVGG